MTTTTDIARAHGHTGPTNCQDCGTNELIHFGSWFDPETGESGNFLLCCTCGIKAGDPAAVHDDCEPDGDGEVDEEAGPVVRVLHRAAGWTMTDPGPEPCTSNFHREQDGRPACTDIAVWKVVEDHGLRLDIGFYCDADLPDEHKPQQPAA